MATAVFSFRPMTQADAEAIALWHYPEPYSFYDWSQDPDDLDELLDPARRGEAYVAVDDPDGAVIGYFSFKEAGRRLLAVGLGLRPDRTGRGLGEAFLAAGLDHARTRFDLVEGFVLSVATLNRRAITVYERAGFVPARVYEHDTNGGVWEFVEMRRPSAPG
jgi:[ribosomal protein S18]-alanine N-acetyltransferase